MSLSREIKLKELLDPKLLFSIALIFVGILDIAHVSDYVRNYDNQFTYSLGYAGNINLLDTKIKPELNQVDFFNAIFMLMSGFFVTIWGSFKFYLWFERREVLILIGESKKK